MRFLIDRCAGRRLAEWLLDAGHDIIEARLLGPDPGDRALLELAAADNRILVTIDTDFGELIHLHGIPHAGLIRLPDVPAEAAHRSGVRANRAPSAGAGRAGNRNDTSQADQNIALP